MKEILYSPWRINYILSEKNKKCIFCFPASKENDEQHFVVHRTEFSFVILNTYPYNNGHLMVVPNNHQSSLSDLSESELTDLFLTVRKTERVINKVYSPDGLNIGLNLGKTAGAGVEGHLHVHIVPRWQGDANFMTVCNGTRVIPEAFERTYSLLKEQFDNETAEK
ncbi:MAG: HIT domain-containing protein [Candidatus Cloacimonetes bacterium]|nr:HIT domain-containing protein [Candidatus Cloacimonadota bacterium]